MLFPCFWEYPPCMVFLGLCSHFTLPSSLSQTFPVNPIHICVGDYQIMRGHWARQEWEKCMRWCRHRACTLRHESGKACRHIYCAGYCDKLAMPKCAVQWKVNPADRATWSRLCHTGLHHRSPITTAAASRLSQFDCLHKPLSDRLVHGLQLQTHTGAHPVIYKGEDTRYMAPGGLMGEFFISRVGVAYWVFITILCPWLVYGSFVYPVGSRWRVGFRNIFTFRCRNLHIQWC